MVNLNNAIAMFALRTPKRIVSYTEVAEAIQIEVSDVEIKLVEAISKQDIFGKIDADTQTLTILGTPSTLQTEPLIEQAQADLQYFDELLSRPKLSAFPSVLNTGSPPLSPSAQPKKRTHSDLLI